MLYRFTAVVTAGSLAIWAVSSVLAAPLINAVAGPEFTSAAPAFRWYLLGMVLVIGTAPSLRALIALGRPGTLFLAELATLGVLVVAVIVGAHFWGLVGVSLAVVLHRATQMTWSLWLVERLIRQRSAAAA